MKANPIVYVAALSLAGCVMSFADDQCSVSEPRQATAAVGEAQQIRIVARAGSLSVRGREGATEVEVRGTACASKKRSLEDVQIDTHHRGNELVIEATIPESRGWSDSRRLDLDIDVPAGLPIEIEDGSGDILVADVGSLRVNDGSGSIEISRVGGPVAVDDGSGSIHVEDVRGAVNIHDGSGGIEVQGVGGDVEVRDGSGEIELRRVEGSVKIRDGSGGIDVADIGGDFDVAADGSGRVRHVRVAGRVSIPRP